MSDNTFWGLTQTAWTAVTALAAVGTLLVAVTAAVFAWRQVRLAFGQLEANRQAQVEADRPYVFLNIEQSPTSIGLLDLVIRNIGRRPAIAVRIVMDPIPVRAVEIDGEELAKARILSEPIAMVAPGQVIRTFFDDVSNRVAKPDMAMRFQVRISYSDLSNRPYSEVSTVECDSLRGTVALDIYGLHHAAKALTEINKTLSRRMK